MGYLGEIPYLQAAMYYFVYYINILMTTFLKILEKLREDILFTHENSPGISLVLI